MSNNPIYELRKYTVYPDKLSELLKIWEENYIYLNNFFNCIGIWTSESGTLNQVYHLYLWESYEQREKMKNAYINDDKMKEYVIKVKKYYEKQESIILKSVDFSKLHEKLI